MIWQFLGVLLLVAINGFFVAAEFALVKVRSTELDQGEAGGGGANGLAQHMLGHLDSYLSACQLGITLASLGLGWAGEPLVAKAMEPMFAYFELPEDKVHYFAFPLAFLLITFLHLTIGEQAPKIAAIQKARATTLLVVYPLSLFHKAFKPFIWLINVTSNGILRIAGLEAVSEHGQSITEEEVRMILTQSAAVGNLGSGERHIMENVLDLESKVARRYMVQRNQIVFLNRNDSMAAKLETASRCGHSRLPLCDGDLDHIIGVVHIKDMFNAMNLEGELTSLVQVARKPLFLPETIKLGRLLRELQRSKNPLAILVDEYGTLTGMITLENVIEEMVGAIEDEFDSETPLIVKKGPNRFELDASCSIDDLVEKCGVDVPPQSVFDSVGGLLIDQLGQIPTKGDKVRVGEHEITVLEAEPSRAVRLQVEKLAAPETTEPTT